MEKDANTYKRNWEIQNLVSSHQCQMFEANIKEMEKVKKGKRTSRMTLIRHI